MLMCTKPRAGEFAVRTNGTEHFRDMQEIYLREPQLGFSCMPFGEHFQKETLVYHMKIKYKTDFSLHEVLIKLNCLIRLSKNSKVRFLLQYSKVILNLHFPIH